MFLRCSKEKKDCSVTQEPLRLGMSTIANGAFSRRQNACFCHSLIIYTKKKSIVPVFSDEDNMTYANCQKL